MATRAIPLTISYVAWDTVNNRGKTGDAANHTLRWVKDGTAAAPANAASEIDAANLPGVYKIALTATETDCDVGTFGGASSSSGVSIIPVTIQLERLPNAAPGTSGGLPLADGSGGVKVQSGTGTGQISLASGQVTVATNNDKTGYSLASAAIAAIWDEPQAGHATAGTFGFYLDAAISSLAGSGGGGAAGTGNYLADLAATRDNIAAQLADLTADPKPTYTIDGQTVDWDTHFSALVARLEQLNRALDAAEPFEIHTTGYTPGGAP